MSAQGRWSVLPTRSFTLVDGGFDPIHPGHIAYFAAAAELGLPVVCLVAGDEYVSTKHMPLLKQSERCAVISAISTIHSVIPATKATWQHLEELVPAVYFKGADWRGRLPAPEVEICSRLNIRIAYSETPLNSSSAILMRFLRGSLDDSEGSTHSPNGEGN